MTRPYQQDASEIIVAAVRDAEKHLRDSDPVLGAVMDDLGPCPIANYVMEPFDALVWTVIGQQISSAAAASISNRLRDRVGGLFTAEALHQISAEELRGVGLSGNKTRTIREFSQRVVNDEINLERLRKFPDHEVMKTLCSCYGIGPWTVEMVLIFGFGRLDIFSGGDLALRKAIGLLHGHDVPPAAAESRQIAEKWAPYRTVASWYLWRTVDPLA